MSPLFHALRKHKLLAKEGTKRVHFKRLIAGITVCLFAFNSFAWPFPEITQTLKTPFPLSLPAELGRVEDYSFLNGPFVIHIQDAHSSAEAQKKILEILEWLPKEKPLLIALEGAVGPLHPEYLDLFPKYPKVNEALVQDLTEEGILSGPDLFAWKKYRQRKENHLTFAGVETPELYRANLKAYRDFFQDEEALTQALENCRRALEAAQAKILNPELRKFIRELERRKEGEYHSGIFSPDLSAHTRFLAQSSLSHLGIDLRDRFEQIRFPNLTRLLFLIEFDRKLNRRQRSLLQSEIDPRKTFEEMALLEEGIRRKLIQNRREEKLVDILSDFQFLRKLLHLEVTREEYQEISGRRGAPGPDRAGYSSALAPVGRKGRDAIRPQTLQQSLASIWKKEESFETLAPFFGKAFEFYRLAGERDHALLENTLERAREVEKVTGKEPIVVLVTGGFHTSGLTALMK